MLLFDLPLEETIWDSVSFKKRKEELKLEFSSKIINIINLKGRN